MPFHPAHTPTLGWRVPFLPVGEALVRALRPATYCYCLCYATSWLVGYGEVRGRALCHMLPVPTTFFFLPCTYMPSLHLPCCSLYDRAMPALCPSGIYDDICLTLLLCLATCLLPAPNGEEGNVNATYALFMWVRSLCVGQGQDTTMPSCGGGGCAPYLTTNLLFHAICACHYLYVPCPCTFLCLHACCGLMGGCCRVMAWRWLCPHAVSPLPLPCFCLVGDAGAFLCVLALATLAFSLAQQCTQPVCLPSTCYSMPPCCLLYPCLSLPTPCLPMYMSSLPHTKLLFSGAGRDGEVPSLPCLCLQPACPGLHYYYNLFITHLSP